MYAKQLLKQLITVKTLQKHNIYKHFSNHDPIHKIGKQNSSYAHMKRVFHYAGPIVQPQWPNIGFQWLLPVKVPVIIVVKCKKSR